MIRAGIKLSQKAVIFGNPEFKKVQDMSTDSESLFIYKAIKKCAPNVQIIIEMMNPRNLQFLQTPEEVQDPNYNPNEDSFQYELTALYAAGEMYHSGIVDTLACQAFYNPYLLTILQQILVGMKQKGFEEMAMYDGLGLAQSNLILKQIPPEFIGKTFEELFKNFACYKDLICLGIYR